MRPRLAARWVALVAAGLCIPLRAAGAEGWNVGATLGGAVVRTTGPEARGAFHLGAHADALFLRRREADMAVGPFVDIGTSGFHSAELGGGASWLVPLTLNWPLVLSLGAFGRKTSTWEPGVSTTLFVGSRSHNFHGSYELMGGLFASARMGLGEDKRMDLWLGAHVDAGLLLLPFVYVARAVTGP